MTIGKIAIVGNPNVGKSSVFNKLGNTYSMVANYPYTTVELVRTQLKIGDEQFELIDCPGIQSLAATSEEILVTRDVLIKENPTVIVQCLDAANIERSLLLTSQLMELDVPLLLTLNFQDDTQKKDIWIDSAQLERVIGVPVVQVVASDDKWNKEFIGKLEILIDRHDVKHEKITYKKIIKNGVDKIRNCFPYPPPPDAVLLLLMTLDADMESWISETRGEDVCGKVRNEVLEFRRTTLMSLPSLITSGRRDWVERILEIVLDRSRASEGGISGKIGMLTRHPVWGWPILAGVIYLIYMLVGKFAANTVVGWLEQGIFFPLYVLAESHISSKFLASFLVGEYGILSTGLGNALATALPILGMFFLILNIMEDSGYFVNLCILVSRFTRLLGLSGQSILPLILGFGCKTMATLSTRILESPKERYITIFLLAFALPCSPQLGMMMGVLSTLHFSAFLLVFGVLLSLELITGIILNRIIKDDTKTDFLIEIPPIKLPSIKNIFIKLYHRMKWFMTEIPPMFMAGAFLLFLLDKTGGLLIIKNGLTPIIVNFLSLPIETVDAFLLCAVKYEAGGVMLLNLVSKNILSYKQIIICLIIMSTFGPCVANFMAIIRQLRLARALLLRGVIIVASFLAGGLVNWLFIMGQKLR